jgi:hypothetical protein
MLVIHAPDALAATLGESNATSAFFHQVIDLSSLTKSGWDISHRSGFRRFYGDGIYFSSPRVFDPTRKSATLEARLNLLPKQHAAFASLDDLHAYLTAGGLNRNRDADQPRITATFLQAGIRSISFPEALGTDEYIHILAGNPTKTFVVYDPSIIYIVDVKQ